MSTPSRARWGQAYARALAFWVRQAYRHAGLVVGLAVLATLVSAWYVATHFNINTDTSALLSRELPFQQHQHALDQAFPQLDNTIVVDIEGQTPGLTDAAAARLIPWLRAHPHDFPYIFAPGSSRFFATHGLLYLDRDQLRALSSRLTAAQPLVASLASDPSLTGLFTLLEQALAHGDTARLAPTLKQISATVQALNHHQFRVLDWQRIMAPSDSDAGADVDALGQRQRFILVKPRSDYGQLQPAAQAIDHLKSGIAALGLNNEPGVQVHLTGSAMLDNEQLGTATSGAGLATGLALMLVLVLLIIALRSPRMVAAALLTLLMGLVWTTALGLLVVGPFNILSIAFAVLFVGLSVDFGIQFCMRSREAAVRGDGVTPVVEQTARGVGGALGLAGAACAISFFSVVPTDYSGLADLGTVAGISMLIATAANLTILPALLTLFGTYRRPASSRGLDTLSMLPLQRWNRWIVGVATLAGIIALPIALSVRFDFNPLSLQDQDSEAMVTLKHLMKNGDFSPYSINLITSDLAAANTLARKLDARPTVAHAISLDSYVPDHQDEKLAIIGDLALMMAPSTLKMATPSPPDVSRSTQAMQHLVKRLQQSPTTPARLGLARALTAFQQQYDGQHDAFTTLQTRLFQTLPPQLAGLRQALQAGRVNFASLPTALVRRYLAADGRARVEVFSKLNLTSNRNLTRFVDDVRQVAPEAAGAPVLLVEGGHAVTRAFAQASATALVLIALLLWLVLGRWRDVALALSTLPLAGLLTAATMKLLGLSFNLANIIVIPLLIGLGVAYGIYFVMRWRAGTTLDQLLHSSTPAAVLFSALTTMVSFGSLALANSPGMAMLGRSLSLSLAYVLITTVIVLPALLSLFPVRRTAARPRE